MGTITTTIMIIIIITMRMARRSSR